MAEVVLAYQAFAARGGVVAPRVLVHARLWMKTESREAKYKISTSRRNDNRPPACVPYEKNHEKHYRWVYNTQSNTWTLNEKEKKKLGKEKVLFCGGSFVPQM